MKSLIYINRSIEYLFYGLFLLAPLIFTGNTSELFEFNKMWLTFGITALIAALWGSKMIILKRPVFKRTPFDIPIFLFLISQIIATIISLDPHVSLWGYYSRWNGGLLSTITYIILFYAFVSNFFTSIEDKDAHRKSFIERNPTGIEIVKRSLLVSVIAGLIASAWALPSHFGYDPTCLVFRGTFDVSCWTNDFQPKVRIFGTMGQPAWLAGYLSILIPITAGFIISSLRQTKKLLDPRLIFYSITFIIFYLALLYTGARSGMIGMYASLFVLGATYIFLNRKDLIFLKNKFVAIFLTVIILVSFFAGIRLPVVENFTFNNFRNIITKSNAPPANSTANQTPEATSSVTALESGGTNSAKIREIVWSGGLDAWRANPLFGTGVETFAFAYYKYRPIEHNNVSEWNFLYNKAHNEYINYLATTGLFGLLTYMSFVVLAIFIALINIFNKRVKTTKYLGQLKASSNLNREDPLILSLLCSFIAILIVNFFGFSVVIMNIYLFLIPSFLLIYLGLIKEEDENQKDPKVINYPQWAGIAGLFVLALTIIFYLVKFWIADTNYALGSNYNRAQEFQTAYPFLQKAVDQRKEPVFEDELAVNKAVLALTAAQQSGSASGEVIRKLATESIATSDKLITTHPNNIIFLKSRVRILYTLANLDPSFMPAALEAIKKAATLAPTDASVLYNLGVLYGQNGDSTTAAKVLEQTIAYKPDYREAHYALALFYHDIGVDAASGRVKDESMRKKAIDQLNLLLSLDPNYQPAKESLSAWQNEK